MRWVRFVVLVLVVTFLQAGVVNIISVTRFNIKPDLLLVLLVFFAIYSNTSEAIITSFTIGFTADLIASSMGTQMISFGLLGTLLSNLHRFIAIRKKTYQSVTIFVVSILAGLLIILLRFIKGQPPAPKYTCLLLLGTSFYSSIMGPFLFLPCAWWIRIKTHRLAKQ